MADPIKRLNYFKHQFLRATDFTDEQKYHIEMRRQHNRSLHTWGIAGGGLKVSFVQGATAVKISEGMALDSQGREIMLIEDSTKELAGFTPGATVFVVISYAERKTDASNQTGAEGETRWTEEPNLRATPTKPSDVGIDIILARVTRNGTTVTSVDETDRRAAGVESGELSVRTLRLSRPDVDAGAWPRLSCSAANLAALENGALKIDANREILFADTGQIRALDNSHRLVFNRANNRLELHEFGDIVFLTGGATPTEKMRIGATGRLGIGVTAPESQLHVSGGAFDLGGSEGDFKIGNPALRLKIGVALGGGGAGDARIRAHGGTNRLMLGSGTTDTMTVVGNNVGIGTVDPKFLLSFANALGDKIALWGSGEAHYGFGIQGGLLQIHTDGQGSDVAFGFGPSASFTETARMKGNGRLGIGTSAPLTQLHIRKDLKGDLGPVLTLMNGAGFPNAGVAIDFHCNDPGANNPPSARLQTFDDNFSGHLSFQTKAPGANTNQLVERLRIRSTGELILSPGSKVLSPMWRALQLATSLQGGLPKTQTLNTNGGLVILFVSGSGWTPTPHALIGMSIKVDGAERAKARAFSNEAASHKTFVPVQLVLALDAGEHKVLLEALPGTLTDHNDFYNVTAVEMPIHPDISFLGNVFLGGIGGVVVNP